MKRDSTLKEVLIVIVIFCILLAIVIPEFLGALASPEEQTQMEAEDRAVASAVLEQKFGEEWKDLKAGDLIHFERHGTFRLIAEIRTDGFFLRSGQPNAMDSLSVFSTFTGSEKLIKRGEGEIPRQEYLLALDQFIQQQF